MRLCVRTILHLPSFPPSHFPPNFSGLRERKRNGASYSSSGGLPISPCGGLYILRAFSLWGVAYPKSIKRDTANAGQIWFAAQGKRSGRKEGGHEIFVRRRQYANLIISSSYQIMGTAQHTAIRTNSLLVSQLQQLQWQQQQHQLAIPTSKMAAPGNNNNNDKARRAQQQ